MPRVELTARLARDTKPGPERDVSCSTNPCPASGLRIHPSGRKVWIVQARIDGRTRRIVIARHGDMAHGEARRRARDLLARIQTGENPADDIRKEKETPTFKAFAATYLRRSDPLWKPSGRKTVRIYLKARILPTFGKMPIDRIDAQDVAVWFDAASKDKPGAANRALDILRSMMFRAEEWGLRERGSNPCLGIRMNAKKPVARFLDTDDLARLGRALEAREARWPEAVAAIRLLALTGMPPERGTQSPLARHWRDFDRPAVGKDRAAICTAGRGRAGADRGVAGRTGGATPSFFRDTPKAGANTVSLRVGRRSAPMPGSGDCGCMTFGTRQPVRQSWRAKTCPWSASSSVTAGTKRRRAMLTLPMRILSKRRRRSAA